MTSSDEGQDRELLQRYRQASDADPRAPSAAVRTAILDEGRRVAASLSVPAVNIEPERRRSLRWKMTAWGTAAAALLAALVIAPRLWNPAPAPTHIAVSTVEQPLSQGDSRAESAEPAAAPRPVVPVMPAPAPRAETTAPRGLAAAPSAPAEAEQQQRRLLLQLQQQQQQQLSSLADGMSSSRGSSAGSYAQRSANASTPLLTAAVAAGDLVKARELLDQGAAINDRDATGRTPLMVAIGQKQIDTVRLLLDRGADPNGADNQGLTPLQLARQRDFDDIAALLIKAGAH